MIRVHVWNFRGLMSAMGHASMHVGAEYVSWWPDGIDRRPKLPSSAGRKVPLYSVRHIQGQSFEDDQLLEADQGSPARPPDQTITLNGLDEPRILEWWRSFNVPHRNWSTLGQNFATTVGRGLMIGGGDDYALGISGWWHSWNTVWQPNDVLKYARAVADGLRVKHDQHEAINFVRRFSKSPLGLTSITIRMDEQGLAHAIYTELGTNTRLVQDVFNVLKNRHNTDADDVAEIYVDLLRSKSGPAVKAVAANSSLKSLLVKILGEGWTTVNEQACIKFLQGLS